MRRPGARGAIFLGAVAIAFLVAVDSCAVDPYLMCGDACDDGGTVDAAVDSSDSGACIADASAGSAAFFCSGAPVCIDAGAPGGNCNTLTNPDTGQTTDCGSCLDPGFTCTSNTCGCPGITCGSSCCTGTEVCDTTSSQCCTRESTAAACGTKCDSNVQDNCHTTVSCGACANGYSCSASACTCTSGVVCGSACCGSASDVCHPTGTCCAPNSTSTTCGGGCGNPVVNNCGENVNCGACSTGEVCKAAGGCACGTLGVVTCLQGQTCNINGASSGSCT